MSDNTIEFVLFDSITDAIKNGYNSGILSISEETNAAMEWNLGEDTLLFRITKEGDEGFSSPFFIHDEKLSKIVYAAPTYATIKKTQHDSNDTLPVVLKN